LKGGDNAVELKTPPNAKKPPSLDFNPVVSIKGLRKKSFPYFFILVFYYAWVVSFATWWTASPLKENVFSMELRSLLHTVILVSSAIFIFIIRKEWFVKTARIGAAVLVASIGLFLIAPNAQTELLGAVIIGIALGVVSTSIFMPAVFVLNNTEKLYAIVGSNVLIGLISLFSEGNAGNFLRRGSGILLSCIILTIALGAIFFFKRDSLPADAGTPDNNTPKFRSRIYLTLLFNCVFVILCKGVGKGLLNIAVSTSGHTMLIWYYLGGLAGCAVYFAGYALSKRPVIWLGNITFGCFAMALFCSAFSAHIPMLALAFSILLGIGSTMGMINMYYIIGVVGKKYNSMRYVRLSVFFIGIFGGVSGVVVGNFVHSSNTFEISMISSIISAALTLLLIMLSSVVSQTQYYNDWAKDSEQTEVDNEQLYMFYKYRLSKREIEVCKLLLEGYTLRQISGILSIAYSTVNTYCTSAYRKLEINSRTELLLLFKDYSMK
jgi:DNA-binding CsgD family transcriptional regulator